MSSLLVRKRHYFISGAQHKVLKTIEDLKALELMEEFERAKSFKGV